MQPGDPVTGTAVIRDYPGNGVEDAGERDAAFGERRHGLLVGRVVDRGDGARRRRRGPGEGNSRESLDIQRLEGPRVCARPVDWAGGTRHPLWPGQRVRDGNPHVRRACLGDRGSVGEFHHGVNDRLAMNDDLDVIKRYPEQKVGLDHFQALID